MRECYCSEKHNRCIFSRACSWDTLEQLLVCGGSPLLEYFRDVILPIDGRTFYRELYVTPCQEELLKEALAVIDVHQGPEEGLLQYYEEVFLDASVQQSRETSMVHGFLFFGVSQERLRQFAEESYQGGALDLAASRLDMPLLIGVGFTAEEVFAFCRGAAWDFARSPLIYGSFFQDLCWLMNRDGRYFHLDNPEEMNLVMFLLDSLQWRSEDGTGWRQILPQLLGILENLDQLPPREASQLFSKLNESLYGALRWYKSSRLASRLQKWQNGVLPFAADGASAWQFLRILDKIICRLADSFTEDMRRKKPRITPIYELFWLAAYLEELLPVLQDKMGFSGNSLVSAVRSHLRVLDTPEAQACVGRILFQAVEHWKRNLQKRGKIRNEQGDSHPLETVLGLTRFMEDRYGADLQPFWNEVSWMMMLVDNHDDFVNILQHIYPHLFSLQEYMAAFFRIFYFLKKGWLSMQQMEKILKKLHWKVPADLCPNAADAEKKMAEDLYNSLVRVLTEKFEMYNRKEKEEWGWNSI